MKVTWSNSFLIENLSYICTVFNIIARRTLLEYCKKYPEAASALMEWYHELILCSFKNFNELKTSYPNASLVGDDRVVFNIMGNKYRLVIRIVFEFKVIQVKWFGTHSGYDKINVSNIQYKKAIAMELKIIKTKKQYNEYLEWVDAMFDKKIKPNTPEGNKVEVALLLIQQYENAHYAIPFPDPIDAIRIKMNDAGLKNKDLVGKFGSKGYISALLNKRKPLTLELAKLFHQELNIPAEILLS